MREPAPGIAAATKLKALGVKHMVNMANGQLAGLVSHFSNDPDYKVINACREGEGVAIAAGLVLGGKSTALSMECIGLFECCDTLRGLAVDMKIPMLLFVGYYGKRTPGWQRKYERLGGILTTVEIASEWTERFLKAMAIPFHTVDDLQEIGNIETALKEARERSGPTALLAERMDD